MKTPAISRFEPVLVAIVAIAASVSISLPLRGCGSSASSGNAVKTEQQETAMQRILKSGKIRCGYLVYSSYFQKEPNTGKLSGIFHDLMEEIGKNANLKVEWTEEVGFQGIFPGLQSKRFDVFAGGLWPNTSRAKAAAFSSPVFYSAITAWVRPDDNRFDKDISIVDSPEYTIATIDGAMEDLISKNDFPKAKRLSLPELTPFIQNLLNVTTRKADITFAEPMVVKEFLRTNPGALKQVGADRPVRIFGNCFATRPGEDELKDFLDLAVQEIVNDGRAAKILARYERDTFYPLARPYALPR